MNNYIYKFIDYNGDIIYVGKTMDIKKRMKQHFGPHPHLPKECYEEVMKIYFVNVSSGFNSEFLETFLINKYHPKYNKDKKYKESEDNIELDIEEPEWKELLFLKIKTKNNLPGIEFLENNPPYINRNFMVNESITKAFEYNFIKLENYKYEFKIFCPLFLKEIHNNFKQIENLYLYAKQNSHMIESNVDEYLNVSPEEQLRYNYLAFTLEKIEDLTKIVPDFKILLKAGIVNNLQGNLFIVRMITIDLLKEMEENIKRAKEN